MTISATKFKAQCLGLMDRVNRTRRPLSITKRGKVVARLFPGEKASPSDATGPMSVLGYARRFRKKARTTEDWMNELRAGERE
jgi:prevent-host-death family protein